MKKTMALCAALISVSAIAPASASNVITFGAPPVQTFTQCFVQGTVNTNTQGRIVARGGWGLAPTANPNAVGNPTWQRSYTGNVRIATRTQRSLPYSYLDPNPNSTCPAFTPNAGDF